MARIHRKGAAGILMPPNARSRTNFSGHERHVKMNNSGQDSIQSDPNDEVALIGY